MPEQCGRARHLPVRSGRLLASLIAFAVVLCMHAAIAAADLTVMSSGTFTAAYEALSARFARDSHVNVVTAATWIGLGAESIPSRLARGEPVDVVIAARTALDSYVKSGWVRPDSVADLARSAIGMAVRSGSRRPDISSVESLRRTLLDAHSIAYSVSVSGDYVSRELFQRLGIADQVLPKSRRVEVARVGTVVARGDAEIGFQQISELLPVEGTEYIGPLPPELQRISIFSVGVARQSDHPELAHEFIKFLASADAASAIAASGMEPKYLVPEIRPEYTALRQVPPFLR